MSYENFKEQIVSNGRDYFQEQKFSNIGDPRLCLMWIIRIIIMVWSFGSEKICRCGFKKHRQGGYIDIYVNNYFEGN